MADLPSSEDLRKLLDEATQGDLTLNRYDHGGGRLFLDETAKGGGRELVADFYGGGGNRELYVLAPALAAEVLTLRTRISTLERAWRPIEEAPKDGTMVLLAFKDGESNWVQIGGWYESGQADRQWYDIYHGPCEPKYWRSAAPDPEPTP